MFSTTKLNDGNCINNPRAKTQYIKLSPKVGGGDGVGGMDEVCGMGALPSDTNIILKTNPLYPTLDGDRPIGCKPVLDIGLGSGGNPTRVATVKTPITLPSDTQVILKGV